MFGTRWQLFRLLGIPVSVDVSWLIILALLTLSLAEGFPSILHEYFPGDARQLAPAEYWIMGLIAALAFFTCIVLHEFGHALVARSRGMPIKGITEWHCHVSLRSCAGLAGESSFHVRSVAHGERLHQLRDPTYS